jgi:hypothetical protein
MTKGSLKAACDDMNQSQKLRGIVRPQIVITNGFWKPVLMAIGGFQKQFCGDISDFQNKMVIGGIKKPFHIL